MRSPVVYFWLILCVVAQVVCCAVPPGTTVCVKSLLAPMESFEATSASAQSGLLIDAEACDSCCCECDESPAQTCSGGNEDRSSSERPSRGPCRDRECLLCVKSFHAVPPARGVEPRASEGVEHAPWAALHVGMAGILSPERGCAWQRPPPGEPCPPRRCLVGTVILQV